MNIIKNIMDILTALKSRKGAEMVEAAISMPVLILTALLLLRTMAFYLEILDTGITSHLKALNEWDSYRGATMRVYNESEEVRLLRGGLLGFDLVKRIDTRSYIYNEDTLVRAGELID